jgi:Zn-dependent peptidase ImmA (M78 family)/transcriptional regulator with XRE-family HTH domain
MAIDLATLGKRLREARINSRLTQEAAAEALGVPRTAIVHMEAGNRSISTIELAELAKLYHRPISDFFAEESAEEPDIFITLGRVAPTFANTSTVNREISRYLAVCQEGIALTSLLGRRPHLRPPDYDFTEPMKYEIAVEQAESVAAEERKRLGLGDAPIADLSNLISSQGIWASGARLPDEMSGLFLHHSSIGMVILVNHAHAWARKRFSYAHEYAHALLDRKRSITVTTKGNASELIERRANAFASAFLMPKTGVEFILNTLDKGGPSRRVYHFYDVATEESVEAEHRATPGSQQITFKDVAILARHFGVSYQAAAYRLSDLSVINRAELRVLLNKEPEGKTHLDILKLADLRRVDDENKPDKELISQIVPLAVEAFRRKEISKKRLLELSEKICIASSDLIALAEAAL